MGQLVYVSIIGDRLAVADKDYIAEKQISEMNSNIAEDMVLLAKQQGQTRKTFTIKTYQVELNLVDLSVK